MRETFKIMETAAGKVVQPRQVRSAPIEVTRVHQEILKYAKQTCADGTRRYIVQRDGSILIVNT